MKIFWAHVIEVSVNELFLGSQKASEIFSQWNFSTDFESIFLSCSFFIKVEKIWQLKMIVSRVKFNSFKKVTKNCTEPQKDLTIELKWWRVALSSRDKRSFWLFHWHLMDFDWHWLIFWRHSSRWWNLDVHSIFVDSYSKSSFLRLWNF